MNHQEHSSPKIVARWSAIRSVYPIYTATAEEFGLPAPPYQSLDEVAGESETSVIQAVQKWLDAMDEQIQPHQFRHILEGTDILSSEDKLRALVQRHLGKRNRSDADREKLHYLLNHYVCVCSPPSFRDRDLSIDEIAEVLEPVLGECPAFVPQWLRPINNLIEQMPRCMKLEELRASILEPGRDLKAGTADMYFGASALVLFTCFNYSARRTFSRLLMSELDAIEQGLGELEARGMSFVDLSPAGLSEQQPLSGVRELLDELRTAVAPPYATSVEGEKTRTLRMALDAAIARATPAPTDSDQGRIAALEKQVSQLTNQLANELSEIRRELASVSAAVRRFVPQGNPPLKAPDPVTEVAAQPPTSERSRARQPQITPSNVSPAVSDMERRIQCCVDELRTSLANESIRSSGVVKFGTVTVLLSDAEMEAICSTADTAVLPQRAIAIRVLLLKQIESGKDALGQDVATTASVARETLSEVQRRLGSSKVALRETLAVSARQLRTVLHALESGTNKGLSARPIWDK